MAYEVTATRKRPHTFEELVGQEFVAATLASAITQGRIAHAYLFAGPRGVGKTSVARILAKALNCETGPTEKPCGNCASCQEIARGSALDVIEIDGASNTSVNDVREIRDEVLFPPQRGRYKIYIIDEVHMLSTSAFNALLKTIEEPPPYVVFVFATTEVHKVPATIRSRCQQYNFRLISSGEIRGKLREVAGELGVEAEDRALAWIAREATGSLRDAYTIFDQVVSFSGSTVNLERIREKLGVLGVDELNEVGRLLAAEDPKAVLEHADAVLAKGVSIEQLVADLAEYFRNLLFLKSGVTRDTLLGAAAEDFDREVLGTFASDQLEKGLELLLSLYRTIRFSLDPRFDLELALYRLARLRELITPAELREAIGALRASASPARGPARSAPLASIPAPSPLPSTPASSSASVAAGAPLARASSRPVVSAQPGASGVPSALPSTAKATGTSRGEPGSSPLPQDPRAIVAQIAESFRREKPALSAALEKATAALEGGELSLRFTPSDRFQGELLLKEKDALNERLSRLADATVRVSFVEAGAEPKPADPRVDLVRKVFRGEIVKGDDRGG